MVPLPPPELPTWLIATIVGVDTVIRLVALGVVPRHRRASTSTAWLLIIFPVPFLGVPLYLVFGSWWAMGRALDDDPKASGIVKELLAAAPGWTPHAHEATAAIMRMNRETTRFGETTGSVGGLYNAPAEAFAAMADAVDRAAHHVHVLYYQTSWDDDTAVLYEALQRAAARGVVVRLLVDHHGLRSIPGWRGFRDRLDGSGLQWHVMLPFNPFKGPVRRPDLRNHRKLLVVDSRTAFVGSHNLVAADYDTPAYAEAGIEFHDTTVSVHGSIARQVETVFATDWFYACGEVLGPADLDPEDPGGDDLGGGEDAEHTGGAHASPMQIVPSGPAYRSEPGLRMFVDLIHCATRSVSVVSPYFIPDEALLSALTNAALKGVDVELFVSEESDQFLVGHAQRSYYELLLKSGVRIHLYQAPTVLHSKYVMIDRRTVTIGSSNMDFRSFGLNYEVMLLAEDPGLAEMIAANDQRYRERSRELTLAEWIGKPWYAHYVDNVCRLGSALL